MALDGYANASDLTPLTEYFLEFSSRSALRKVFDEQTVPMEAVGQHDVRLPYADLCAIYERAARTIGDPVFGARCGTRWGYQHTGPLGEYANSATNLGQFLNNMLTAVHLYESGSNGSLQRLGDLVTFSYFTGFNHPLGRNHYADANLGLLLNIVKQFTGPDWRPVRMTTDNLKSRHMPLLEAFHEAPIHCGEAAISLVFPVSDMDAPNPSPTSAENALTLRDLDAMFDTPPPSTIANSVEEMVRLRLLAGLTDIAGVARHLRLGVRALQVRLSKEGTNYRAIVARERCRRASALLTDTEFSITDIALSLGYKYASDFTRAFTRCYGYPPNKVRNEAERQSSGLRSH